MAEAVGRTTRRLGRGTRTSNALLRARDYAAASPQRAMGSIKSTIPEEIS